MSLCHYIRRWCQCVTTLGADVSVSLHYIRSLNCGTIPVYYLSTPFICLVTELYHSPGGSRSRYITVPMCHDCNVFLQYALNTFRREQERKKQLEAERQAERQRQLEAEREEQRRKAMEAREAARQEMERQRQREWEQQRKSQLLAEKNRHLVSPGIARSDCHSAWRYLRRWFYWQFVGIIMRHLTIPVYLLFLLWGHLAVLILATRA